MSGEKPIGLLIVDDEKTSRYVLEQLLSSDGRKVRTARDGLEAKALLQEEPADLVLTDLNMPGMDGMALLRHVRTRFPRTLVIMVTGFASLDSTLTAVEEGAYDYITKPFKLAEMELVVRNACDKILVLREKERLMSHIGRMEQERQALAEEVARLETRIKAMEEKEERLLLENFQLPTTLSYKALPVRYNQDRSRKKHREILIARLHDLMVRGEISEQEYRLYVERLRRDGTIVQT
ncbi:MAG: response regulator [bacterium]|nr:response regulator [bacterium]